MKTTHTATPTTLFRPRLILATVACLLASALQVSTSLAAPVISRNINTYVLFAYTELIWKGGNVATNSGYITGGNIGVNFPDASPTGFSLAFGTSGRGIMSPGYQAVADSVRADDDKDIFYDLFANSVNPSFGATVMNPNPATSEGNYPFTTPIIEPADLPILPFTPNRPLTNNASNLEVPQSSVLTLALGPYRDVVIHDDAIVTLLPGVYDIRDLKIGKNVTINVDDATILQIDQQFNPNDMLKFGTNAGNHGLAKVLVGGFGDNVNTTRSTNFSHNAIVHMQYFAPNSWLDLGGGNELHGRFWANRITGDPNNNVHFSPEPMGWLLLATGGSTLFAWRRMLLRSRGASAVKCVNQRHD